MESQVLMFKDVLEMTGDQEGKLSQSCYPGPSPCNLLAKAPLTVLPWKYYSTVLHSIAKKITSVPIDENDMGEKIQHGVSLLNHPGH